ncbi:6298_t:CDS:1, partial [Acaulospora morrowiae]
MDTHSWASNFENFINKLDIKTFKYDDFEDHELIGSGAFGK